MKPPATPSEERPLLLLLPGPDALAPALRAILSHEQVRAYALPALWDLAWGSVDALEGLPDLPRLDLASLEALIGYLRRAATPEARDALVAKVWSEVPGRVREWYLGRGTLTVLASIFKVGRPAGAYDPPEAFRRDRVIEARFEAAYRLHAVPGAPRKPVAPPEEASVVFYPFDLAAEIGRAEAGPEAARAGAALEVFAYEGGRARHRALLDAVARAHGWTVLDPSGG